MAEPPVLGDTPTNQNPVSRREREQPMASGRHGARSRGRRALGTSRRRTIEMVDAVTLTAHLLTDEAAAAGRASERRYVALCGVEVLPAALVEPGRGPCRSCLGVPA